MPKRRNLTILLVVVALAAGAAIFDYPPLWNSFHAGLHLPDALLRPWRLGLDLVGGSYLVYDIDLGKVAESDRSSVVSGLRDVIERRVNLFGVAEPQVFISKSAQASRLIVELSGIKDVNQAIKEIGETPFLSFHEVSFSTGTSSSTAGHQPAPGSATATATFIPTPLTGRYVTGAQLDFDSVTRQPQVNIQFNGEGATIFENLTAKNIGRPIAIFLDSELIEAPIVRDKIIGGRAQISGNFTLESAQKLIERFNAGALPAPITLVSQQTIGASLGEASLQKAIWAGVIGTAAIILFMIAYYRLLGFFASLALIVYIALTLAIFKAIPITLTLAGVAGLILSIGMAVDANILIFERTKEELRRGLGKSAALEEGFRRAWTSIRDSNISTIITSIILYFFTSSFVKGFALALLIGVLVSMFSAINVTRTFLRTFVK